VQERQEMDGVAADAGVEERQATGGVERRTWVGGERVEV